MPPDFGAWRRSMRLYQADAAALFQSHRRAWQNWEAGKPAPGTARVLLEVLQEFPAAAQWLLHKLKGEK